MREVWPPTGNFKSENSGDSSSMSKMRAWFSQPAMIAGDFLYRIKVLSVLGSPRKVHAEFNNHQLRCDETLTSHDILHCQNMHRSQVGVRPCSCSQVLRSSAGQSCLSPQLQLRNGRGATAARPEISVQAEGKFFVGGNWKCNGGFLTGAASGRQITLSRFCVMVPSMIDIN